MRGKRGLVHAAAFFGRAVLLVLVVGMAVRTAGAAGGAPTAPVTLQLFSTLDRGVVAEGLVFVLEVEAYATLDAGLSGDDVREAFLNGQFGPATEALAFVRAEPLEERREVVEGGDEVLVLGRRFFFRALQLGVVEVPVWQMQLRGRTYATAAHRVHVYEVHEAFFDAARAVLPLVARSQTSDGRHAFTRIGSAFLATPDALVTAYHVVMDAVDVRVTLPNGRRLSIPRAWVLDPERDVAVLYIDPVEVRRAGLASLRMAPVYGGDGARSLRAAREEVVFTDGWPAGTQRSTAGVYFRDLLFQPDEVMWISTNPVRPGDSGGPLLDAQGQVLGVVSAGTLPTADRTVPLEEVCVSTDPRPALYRKLTMNRPRSLRRYLRDDAFTSEPHAQALRLAGQFALRDRRLTQARALLAELDTLAARRSPPDAGLLFLLASLHRMLDTGADPIVGLKAVLEASDSHLPALYVLGLLQLEAGTYDAAEQVFRDLARYAPYRTLAGYGLARTLMERLRYAEAVPYLREVLRSDPNFAPAYYWLAFCYIALEEASRARQLLVPLNTKDPYLAGRLRRALQSTVFQPIRVRPLPKAQFSKLIPNAH